MQRLEVSGAVRPIYASLDVKRLSISLTAKYYFILCCCILQGYCWYGKLLQYGMSGVQTVLGERFSLPDTH